MNKKWIQSLLPHRPPMLLVDSVLSLSPGRELLASKTVTGDEPCFASIPGRTSAVAPYSNALVIESLCQAGALLCAATSEGCTAGRELLFGSIAAFRFHACAYRGDTLYLHVRLDQFRPGSAVFSGQVRVHESIIAEADQLLVVMRSRSAPSHFVPQDLPHTDFK